MRRRQAFTLVELLVSMALIVFVMAILSQAFVEALNSFSHLKAIGDMDERMRSVSNVIRRDLDADHFEARKRLSDPSFWGGDVVGPPREGFFRVWQGFASTSEGSDNDGGTSGRATSHILHFTVKLRGNERKDFFTALIPDAPPGDPVSPLQGAYPTRYQDDNTNTFQSQWAEVAYFVRRNGSLAGTTPLYSLYRRQRLLVPDDITPAGRFGNGRMHFQLNWGTNQNLRVSSDRLGDYPEVSCNRNPHPPASNAQFLYFNDPTDVTMPVRRFGMNQNLPNPTVPNYPRHLAGLPVVSAQWLQANNFPSDPDITDDPRTWTYPTLAEEDQIYGRQGGARRAGDDLLVTDVLSFQVQVLTVSGSTFGDLSNSGNTEFNSLTTKPRVFDTWSKEILAPYDYGRWSTWATTPAGNPEIQSHPWVIPAQTRIYAIKVTVRVWDLKTNQARQITIIQDM